MTTSNTDIENSTSTTDVETSTNSEVVKDRTINELLYLSYSDMSESEIAKVVEWKAERLANETENKQKMQELEDTMTTLKEEASKSYEVAKATQEELLEQSRALFDAVMKIGQNE